MQVPLIDMANHVERAAANCEIRSADDGSVSMFAKREVRWGARHRGSAVCLDHSIIAPPPTPPHPGGCLHACMHARRDLPRAHSHMYTRRRAPSLLPFLLARMHARRLPPARR